MATEQVQSFFALAMGFAMAGMLATGYQLATRRPASFRLLQRGPSPSTIATVPFLAFAAPFIIMRNTIRSCQVVEGRRFEMMMLATVVAGFWSLMSGTVVMMMLRLLQL